MAPPPGWLPSILLQPYLSSPLWQEPGPPHIHQSHPAPNPLSLPPCLSPQTPESRQVGMAGGGDSKPIPSPSSPPLLLSPFPPGAQTLLKSRPPNPHSPPLTPRPEALALHGASLPGKWRHLQAPGRAAASAPHPRGLGSRPGPQGHPACWLEQWTAFPIKCPVEPTHADEMLGKRPLEMLRGHLP